MSETTSLKVHFSDQLLAELGAVSLLSGKSMSGIAMGAVHALLEQYAPNAASDAIADAQRLQTAAETLEQWRVAQGL